MMCKPDYATICKVNYAMHIFIVFNNSLNSAIIVIFNMAFFIKILDKQIYSGIISLTVNSKGKIYEKTKRPKIRGATKTGVFKSSSRAGQKRAIPTKRLFRSPGLAAGQIRNASSGNGRTTAYRSGRASVRFFPAIVLPGFGQFQTKRAAGSNTQQAWPSQGTQVERTGSKIHPRAKSPRCNGNFRQTGPTDKRQVRSAGAQAKYSTGCYAQEKKIALKKKSVQQAVLNGATDPLCEHYEQLRGYMLEVSDMPGQVYGLGVMLQKGMRAWIEATCEHSQVKAAYGNVDSHEVAGMLSSVQTELARMLAGIVLKHNHREAF
jgi:hypothetical protein